MGTTNGCCLVTVIPAMIVQIDYDCTARSFKLSLHSSQLFLARSQMDVLNDSAWDQLDAAKT